MLTWNKQTYADVYFSLSEVKIRSPCKGPGTPREVVEKIHRDTAKALDAPEIKARFEGLGMSPVGNSPADFAKAIGVESVHWARIVRERRLLVE